MSSNQRSSAGSSAVVAGLAAAGVFAAVVAGGPEPAAANTATSAAVLAEIPDDYKTLYRASGGLCPGVDAALLAGMGWVESRHGQLDWPGVHTGANSYGARGPMQFIDLTWGEVRADLPDIGDNPYDPAAAIPAAAYYVCKYAAVKGVRGALVQYGGGRGYPGKVRPKAAEYRAAGL